MEGCLNTMMNFEVLEEAKNLLTSRIKKKYIAELFLDS